MPITKRKGIIKTGKMCDACKLKGMDVHCQIKPITDENIDFIEERMNVSDTIKKLLISILKFDRDTYTMYQCYVCG